MAKRKRRSRAESSDYWRRQIASWKQSGQTIRAFFSERNLTESQFHLWKRSLGAKPATTPVGSGKDPTTLLQEMPSNERFWHRRLPFVFSGDRKRMALNARFRPEAQRGD